MYLDLANGGTLGKWGGDEVTRFAMSETTRAAIAAVRDRDTARTVAQREIARSSATDPSLAERLALSRSQAKLRMNSLAMWMRPEWRQGLARQLDSLLDPEEWDEDDTPLSSDSFASFLQSMFYLKPNRRPGLAVSSSGNLIATWKSGPNYLTVEYQQTGKARWIVANQVDGDIERVAGSVATTRLAAALHAYIARTWFQRPND
jgi:hypothetical protein